MLLIKNGDLTSASRAFFQNLKRRGVKTWPRFFPMPWFSKATLHCINLDFWIQSEEEKKHNLTIEYILMSMTYRIYLAIKYSSTISYKFRFKFIILMESSRWKVTRNNTIGQTKRKGRSITSN